MEPTVSAYHRADVGPDGLCRIEGCGRRAIAHLTTRADAFRRLNDALEASNFASTVETRALTREIIRQDNRQSWPSKASELSDLQKALIVRAVNTEINLLQRLYGVSEGTLIKGHGPATFVEQVQALSEVEQILYPSELVDFGVAPEVPDAAHEDALRRERDYDEGVIRDDDH